MKKHMIFAAMALSLSMSAVAAEQKMRILIVNDDGCDSYGTTALQEKLTAKGHDVWMVAPATNQSGIGSAITFKPGKVFDVKKTGEKRYCFPGTPADAVDFGILGVMRGNPPDLVISGVNDGPNTGVAQLNSGTVGAAVRALRYGYPSIAASIGYILTEEEMKNGWPSTAKYWPDSVDYVVGIVDTLAAKWEPGKPVLPKGSGFSINYPAQPKDKIQGIKYIKNEYNPIPQHFYDIAADGTAKQVMSPDVLKPSTADTDTGWLNKDYITHTIYDGDWNAEQFVGEYEKLLSK